MKNTQTHLQGKWKSKHRTGVTSLVTLDDWTNKVEL